jgi:DMSO/TMAO reductase YedYZ heme-binding membrane subunit
VIHFLWRVKADHRRPAIFAAIVGLLLGARVLVWIRARTAAVARRR